MRLNDLRYDGRLVYIPVRFATRVWLPLQFVVFTKVIDKKTMNIILATMVSFFSTTVPLVLALLPDDTVPTGGGLLEPCALSASQVSCGLKSRIKLRVVETAGEGRKTLDCARKED